MHDIDLPGLKTILWHRMRGDLQRIVPWFADYDLLLCPTCCRRLGFDDFSIEHIIPQQALVGDPALAKGAISRNQRSGMTLLCHKPLVIKGKKVNGNGCNGWKGKYFDPFLRTTFVESFPGKFTQRNQIALIAIGYLGLVRRYGYQIALLPSGLVTRAQFFSPNAFTRDFPIMCQMVLGGAPISEYSDEADAYWSEPFKFVRQDDKMIVSVRNVGFFVPISRDPEQPFSSVLPYVPPRLQWRPDLTSVFD